MSSAVTRWRRYGKDRLYVTDAAGEKVGYVDLLTGLHYPESPAQAAELGDVVSAWHARAEEQVPTAAPPRAPVRASTAVLRPAQPAAEPAALATARTPIPPASAEGDPPREQRALERSTSEDLASRRAGAMAREQAVALKQAAPVRTFLARALGVHTDERAWRIGADGEEKVAQLAKLASRDPRWHFLHAVPVGENGADIDHVVIGPAGVFTLNAKHHPGAKIWVGGNTLMVNGQRQPYLRNSAHEARRASRLLTTACGYNVTVTGVVVPVGADDVVIKTPPTDVHVVDRRALATWLRERPAVLTRYTIDAVFAAGRRSTTWVQPGR